jgi:NAD(P)H-quinone oxidoreductase subunit 5
MGIMQAQPLNPVHVMGIVLLAGCWLGILFGRYALSGPAAPEWMMRFYVQALNASQPHPQTVTAHRNHYKFL